MFQLKCKTEYTVKFLYQGHDVFDMFVPRQNECTEYLWNINWHLFLLNKRSFICMWYKEAKPSNSFPKNSSEKDRCHFRYRHFKFPIYFIQREIIWDGKKFKFSLTSFDGNFELDNIVVLLTDICARHLWKVKWHLFYTKGVMTGNVVLNKGLITP